MDSADRRLSPDRTKDTTSVTYAQARDLTYGSQELRPPCNRRRQAGAGTAAPDSAGPAAAAGRAGLPAGSGVPAGPGGPAAASSGGREPSAGADGVLGSDRGVDGTGGRGDDVGGLGDREGPDELSDDDLTEDDLSEMALKPGTESVKVARDFTAETLHGWHLDGLIEDAVIIASELVTNAIRHGTAMAAPSDAADPPGVELAWQRFASQVTCVVTDASSRPPVLSAADMSAESGRGLQVVHALAAAWGWMMIDAREKAVWATLLLPPSASLSPPRYWI